MTDAIILLDDAKARYAAANLAFTPVPDESIADESARAAAHAEAMARRNAAVAAAQREIVAHTGAQLMTELLPDDIENPGDASSPIAAAVNALAAAVLAAVKE